MSTTTSGSMTEVAAYAIGVGVQPLDHPERDSIGGWPFLDVGQGWPACFCGERMVLFFQFDVPGDVEHFGGSHLLVFHCREHNDASGPPDDCGQLAPAFWNAPQPPYPAPFWRVLLQDGSVLTSQHEPRVQARALTVRRFQDEPDAWGRGAQLFKVGGAPSWAQGAESYQCACGAELRYLCQVPENMEFTTLPDAPEQPYSMPDAYQLFLGNEVYLLACPKRCDPAAVWPVNQN